MYEETRNGRWPFALVLAKGEGAAEANYMLLPAGLGIIFVSSGTFKNKRCARAPDQSAPLVFPGIFVLAPLRMLVTREAGGHNIMLYLSAPTIFLGAGSRQWLSVGTQRLPWAPFLRSFLTASSSHGGSEVRRFNGIQAGDDFSPRRGPRFTSVVTF